MNGVEWMDLCVVSELADADGHFAVLWMFLLSGVEKREIWNTYTLNTFQL